MMQDSTTNHPSLTCGFKCLLISRISNLSTNQIDLTPHMIRSSIASVNLSKRIQTSLRNKTTTPRITKTTTTTSIAATIRTDRMKVVNSTTSRPSREPNHSSSIQAWTSAKGHTLIINWKSTQKRILSSTLLRTNKANSRPLACSSTLLKTVVKCTTRTLTKKGCRPNLRTKRRFLSLIFKRINSV